MITTIKDLKELPYKTFHGYVLKKEDDVEFIGDKRGYIYVSGKPKCIFLFVETGDLQSEMV
jgi:hypothetical protein